MVNVIVEVTKYVIILLMAVYTFSCFSIFLQKEERDEKRVLIRQNILMFGIHFMAYMVLYLKTEDKRMVILYLMQVVFFAAVIILNNIFYPNVSRLIVNNMCMLLCVGFIILGRLSFGYAIRQFIFAAIGSVIGLSVPVIIRKMKVLTDMTYIYAGVGFVALVFVALFAKDAYGAKLGFSIAGFGIQPSEFVKILFVFFVASSLRSDTSFKRVVLTTVIAAAHVLVLVLSTDLGAALIYFVVYLVMLYVATRQPLYAAAGLGAGSVAAVAGYHLFSHVKVRVAIWQDPFAHYSENGYQIVQGLFAIGTGSWFGMGLYQGSPELIPIRESDYIFAAISEELGLIFSLCLILVFVSCYIMFLNIAMEIHNQFYKLVALGLGTCYISQVFLNIGGVSKFIPLTGVTLPLVSYGGSSILSTLILFGIIQGLYIIREDEERKEKKEKQERARERRRKNGVGRTADRKAKKTTKGNFEEVPKQRIR